MSEEFEEIIAEFINESQESLDAIDPLFVELETKGDDREIINEIFRSIHTIKGAAGFLGFQQIVEVTHRAENILKRLRDGEIKLTTPMMNTILKSVDMVRLLIAHIKNKDGFIEDTSSLLQELDAVLEVSEEVSIPHPSEHVVSSEPLEESESEESKKVDSEFLVNPIKSIKGSPEVTIENISYDKSTTLEKGNITASLKESKQTLRVDVDKIDKVMNLTGEVVLVRNRLLNIVNYLSSTYPDDSYVDNLYETVSFLDLVTSDMQLAVMRMRMQPIKKVFGKFPRLVRDIANSLNKDVELIISGEDTEVDKAVIEQIGDPLVHIIRNAIDHGIEPRDERIQKGKPEKGTISIDAYQKGNQIVIEVSDDGKGIDVVKVKKKAIEKGLITEEEASKMTDDSAINLIFLPGFSTRDISTELSGRGVGMDVVKTNISKLNGYVEVKTRKDLGSTFIISIPLTLAIIETLMVKAGGSRYAIPLSPVEEITKVPLKDIYEVVGQKVVRIRDKVYPIYSLADILGNRSSINDDHKYAIIISIGAGKFCLSVEELLGQEEVVIKTIEGIDTSSSYILGATITGDGKVVLILDLANISRNALGLTKV